ncbi:MAG TPA: bifunctional diguanylate cyclase/phosphodiesterase [Syntrophales bacterium]|nr:bifunctional diguanylate cyclase/phosphodiesterase [Syntrophales bacterium]
MKTATNSRVNPEVSRIPALLDEERKSFLDRLDIRPHFQPIIDLLTCSVVCYEVLSRGTPPYESPKILFEQAKALGLTWDVERACRVAALRRISTLPPEFVNDHFCINVSPEIFGDPRFIEGFTQKKLDEYGIDRGRIVIEITEERAAQDLPRFERIISHYVEQGFKISLDDFGSGYSGLVTLVASAPHYMKLDMALVRDIHRYAYKQKLVKSMVSFASSVESRLVAEGVETVEELETLVKLGVRYAQGFLLGRPQPFPCRPSAETNETIREQAQKYNYPKVEIEENLNGLVVQSYTIQRGTMRCEDLNSVFKRSPNLTHVVILEDKRPWGLITKQHFYGQMGGQFGYQLFRKKAVEFVCKPNALTVDASVSLTLLAKLAMDRFQDDLYDPVIVVDGCGDFIGTVTMKQVIVKSSELEIRRAMNANPLTNLPGNEIIRIWINEAMKQDAYSIVYADLDRFKEFNDSYGFLVGDQLLTLTAKILAEETAACGCDARLGHIGGDDFVIVCHGIVAEETLTRICRSFDARKLDLFHQEHRATGQMEIVDRRGERCRIPLVTLSLAVVDSRTLPERPHPAFFSEAAASLKKKVKKMTLDTGESQYSFDRRNYTTKP